MDYSLFKKYIGNLSSAASEQGKHYSNVMVKGDQVWYTRESGSREDISIKELYGVYSRLDYINTTILREYISGRKYSPSLAILKSAGLYDESGYRTTSEIVEEIGSLVGSEIEIKEHLSDEPIESNHDKAEGKFFAALGNLLDNKYVQAKSIGKPVRSDQVVLNSHFEVMGFSEDVNVKIRKVLDELESDYMMPRNTMVQHIDGMIVNHPTLGTRIVEFDEEQHFTPARLVTLPILDLEEYTNMITLYTFLIKDVNYFEENVLKKHRLKLASEEAVPSWKEMKELIQVHGKSNNGYIAPKSGFPYLGGRIAQRAFYDLLRDLAHLSSFNTKLQPAIRVPKHFIELQTKSDFENLSLRELQQGITQAFEMMGYEF